MDRTLTIAVYHGRVKATPHGPAFNNNTQYIQRVIHQFADEILPEAGHVDLLVLHAYPSTGNIPGYVEGDDLAREKIRQRSLILNPTAATSSNPLHMILSESARLGVNILYGPVYEVAGPRYYVTTALVTPEGEVYKYRRLCLTPRERRLGLSPGNEPVVFTITRDGRVVGRIGVFSDMDLACPELFRSYRIMGVDVILGHAMPSPGQVVPLVEEGQVVTYEPCMLDKLVTVRAMDSGVPLVLVGGVLNIVGAGGRLVAKHWAPTVIVDPEGPGLESCFTLAGTVGDDSRPFLGPDSIGRFKTIHVESNSERSLVDDPVEVNCKKSIKRIIRSFCGGRR